MLLLCALVVGSSSVWADSYTIGWGTASGNNSQNFTATSGSVTGVVSFSCAANSSSAPAYNSNNSDLRLYAQTSNGTGNGGSITLTPANGVTITGAVVTTTTEPTVHYFVNGGDGVAVSCDNKTYTVTGISATTSLTFKNVTETNVQFRIKTIAITYTTSLSPSDLALTDAPINLNFDLYNNTTAQVIHYTTSSTGAVTVSDNDYITTSVDQNNKTITVTPKTTETPSTQTITVSQAADNTYSAGSKTFTVTIDDSTPDPYNWVETSLANLTSSDIFAIVGTSSAGSFLLPNNNGTVGAPTATTVTITNSKITSRVKDFLKWNLSGNATDGYTFYPNGDDAIWLYCNTDAQSGSNDNMRVGTGDRKVFQLDGNYLKTKDNKTARYLCVYGSQDWRGYISASPATTIKFYKRVDASQPIISANDVNIAWNANGSIAYGITNPVDGGNLTASTTADWITIGTINADNVSFTATANSTTVARTATVTLTYTYNTNQTVTKDVIVTQAAGPYSTISSLFDAATTTDKIVLVTFNNWVVSGISTNGKNVFVTDGTNGFVIYSSSDQSSIYAVGNILSGTGISCTLKKTNGYAQITELASTPTINTGGTISEANIGMNALAGVNTGALVSYDNLTCSVDNNKYYLSDGTTQLQVYSTLYAFGTLKAGMKYNITGIYQQYGNSTKEILPRSAADIVEVAAVITPAKTYTTLTAASALNFTGLSLEAYIVKDNDVSDGSVTLTKVNKVPANTGLVLKASSTGSPIDVPVLTGTADDVTGNLMAGSATATTAVAANAGYILSDGVFQPALAGTLPAGKAYLNIAAGARTLEMNFDDEGITAVKEITNTNRTNNTNEVFDLQGRRVAQPTKGMYIVNGKKVVIK